MRYFIRAVKYFLHLAVLVTALMAILIAIGMVPADIGQIFTGGWVSVAEIAALFLVFAGIYPKIGYARRTISLSGDWEEVCGMLRSYMSERGDYVEEEGKSRSKSGDSLRICFRARKLSTRIARTWEDRLTFTPTLGGVEIEGPTKDVAKMVSAIEYRYREDNAD